MRKLFRELHLWLSLPFGLLIMVTCFTGAMLMFENEVTLLCNYRATFVVPDGRPLPIDVLVSSVKDILPEDIDVTDVVVYPENDRAYKVKLSAPKHAAMYVNQYTGEVTGDAGRLQFFRVMRHMHRWLMDDSRGKGGVFWGRLVVGTSTIASVVILITGIVLWVPRSLSSLRNRLKIVATKGYSRFCYDLHVAGGFYVALLLLTMAVTGLTWSFSWYRNGFYALLGVEEVQGIGRNRRGQETVNSVEWPSNVWQRAYETVAERNPGKLITVSKGRVAVAVGGLGNQEAVDCYTYNVDGDIVDELLYEDSGRLAKIRGWIYSLHVGSWGGLLMRVLYFLAALFGATLPLTGYYMWFKTLLRNRGKRGRC
ncbi:MAG: PepSY domain-containing protein [Bacteroidaceae bacterium]|nr:PepSY domain-containing protein [Bacteroidaceae bacterium]